MPLSLVSSPEMSLIVSDLWRFLLASELAKASEDLYQDRRKYSRMLLMAITKYDFTSDKVE